MRRTIAAVAVVLGIAAFAVIGGAAASGPSAVGTYKIEFDNAFGLVTGSQLKVAGVPAGILQSIDLDQKTLHAVVTVRVTQGGFGAFHADAFCQSRPQSLIGEYFIDCQPGESGPVLAPGSTIPVTHTQSTIPADLLQNVLRLPYRERLALIINELGAGVAGRSDDLEAALRRAVPALTETDNLLNLLANDSKTLQRLTVNSDAVVTALANNKRQVARFITEANNTATATARQHSNLRASLRELPGFLEQLRPAMAKLGAAATANQPVLANLNASASQLDRFFTNLTPFSKAALPAIRSLGRASVTGKAAVQAAAPTVQHLQAFAQPTPELAQNLAIVLHDLDDRGRAVEPDPRSPEGKGYTGLEALLQYVFNQTLAINTFGPFGHVLAVDAFVNPKCTPYATPATIALSLQKYGPSYRQCYAWLGPSQPGVNETDPSDTRACVPDPGGAPPGQRGPRTAACKLTAAAVARTARLAHAASPASTAATTANAPGAAPSTPSTPSASGNQTRQLLNYLLAP
jgi:virulence factor Mce-like protein